MATKTATVNETSKKAGLGPISYKTWPLFTCNASTISASGKAPAVTTEVDHSAILLGIAQILEHLSEHFDQMGGQSSSAMPTAPAHMSRAKRPHSLAGSIFSSNLGRRMFRENPYTERRAPGGANLGHKGRRKPPATILKQIPFYLP